MCNSMLPKAAPKAAPQAARIIVGGGVSRLTHAFEVHRLARATGAGSEPADRPARHDADAREGPEGREGGAGFPTHTCGYVGAKLHMGYIKTWMLAQACAGTVCSGVFAHVG